MNRSRSEIKNRLKFRVKELLYTEPRLREILYQVFEEGVAYIVGGFIRDTLLDIKSRDIDIIVGISNKKLVKIIESSGIVFQINHHGGIKMKLNNTEVDIWSIYDNWAFKKELITLNEDKKMQMKCIAEGCFFNYDALVFNLNNNGYNIQFYDQFLETHTLDILRKSSVYKNTNPTQEANIIRAFYIKKKYDAIFSDQLCEYILKMTSTLSTDWKSSVNRILYIKKKYDKYAELSDTYIINGLNELLKNKWNNDLFLS